MRVKINNTKVHISRCWFYKLRFRNTLQKAIINFSDYQITKNHPIVKLLEGEEVDRGGEFKWGIEK